MNFMIVLTDKCNLRCKYCYEKEKTYSDMSVETARKSILFVKDCITREIDLNRKEHNIVFHGGEPLLKYDMIKYFVIEFNKISNVKIQYYITSNGTIFKEEIAYFIKNNNINFSISIDGTKSSHDKNRVFPNGRGSYNMVIDNAMKYLSIIENIRCRLTFSPDTINEIYSGVSTLSELGFCIFAISENFYCTEWQDNSIELLLKQINKLKRLKENKESLDISLLELKEHFLKEKNDCFGGITSMTISTTGKIYPCIFNLNDRRFCIGNIDDDLIRINSTAVSIHEKINRVKSICSFCSLKKYCNANRCKLLNVAVNGNSRYANPIVCEMTKMKWRMFNVKCKI